MQFGVCGGFDVAAIASRASYDYAEWSVPELLKPRESDEVFAASLEKYSLAPLTESSDILQAIATKLIVVAQVGGYRPVFS